MVTRVSRSRRTRKFAQDSTVRAEYLVRAGLDGSRRVSRSRRTRRFAQDSTVRAGLDGSRRTRRFAQDSTVRAGLDGSRRQNSTVRAGLNGSRRTRPFWPLRRMSRHCKMRLLIRATPTRALIKGYRCSNCRSRRSLIGHSDKQSVELDSAQIPQTQS